MIAFVTHNLAPIMFGSLILFLLLGYPVAFSLAALGIGYWIVGMELGIMPAGAVPGTCRNALLGSVMANETLLAIPFFTFMGLVLERSGMAEKLLDTVGKLFGPVARRRRLRRHLRRRASGGHDRRRGRGLGHRHGPDLAADHAALRLRPAARHGVSSLRRAHWRRSSPPSLVLIVLAEPARQVGRRHVSRRLRARLHPDRPLRALRSRHRDHPVPERRAGVAAGGAIVWRRRALRAGGQGGGCCR